MRDKSFSSGADIPLSSYPCIVFSGELERFVWDGGRHFVDLGTEISSTVRSLGPGLMKTGWWYVRVIATVGSSKWDTTIFPTKTRTFFLAVKATVRRRENLHEGDRVSGTLHILLNHPHG